MACFRYMLLAMLCALVCLPGCGSGRARALKDPAAQSGAGSEEIWYRYGGARVAYTAIPRPRQLYAGYGVAPDPALYGQAPATTLEKAPTQRRSRPKAATPAPRPPDCPPCPPATDAVTSAPPNTSAQSGPARAASDLGANLALPPSTAGPGVVAPPPAQPAMPSPGMPATTSSGALPPLPPLPGTPLSGMPAATPAPPAPNAPGM